MSIETVRLFLREKGFEDRIREFGVSSATVNLAAQAVGCEPARIAKTLSFLVDGRCVLIVAAGDAKIDNSKYKAPFHTCLLYTSTWMMSFRFSRMAHLA